MANFPHSLFIFLQTSGSRAETLSCRPMAFPKTVELWFSTFLMRRPFSTVSHVVLTPNRKIISLLLHNCNFGTIVNHNHNLI